MFRPRDLKRHGVPLHALRTWVRRGDAEVLGRGLYRARDAEISELETLAWVAKRAPRAVVCLLSALRVHEIGTQSPPDVWIALPGKAHIPRVAGATVRVVRFSERRLEQGVEERRVHGVTVRITDPVRTVVDCFRYRNKFGVDVAVEALRDLVQSRRATIAEIDRAAEQQRMRRVMRPYLEALIP